MKFLAFAFLLSCGIAPALAVDALEAAWLRLIQAEFDSSCVVEKVGVGTAVFGNNGLRTEQWFLQTCLGAAEYWVAYYPPEFFPDRASPFEVARVVPAAGARPN